MWAPVWPSHCCIVEPKNPEATLKPSGENVTEWTESECPLRVTMLAPVLASQSRTVSSSNADKNLEPSGESAMDLAA